MKRKYILVALVLFVAPSATQANHIDFIADGGFLLSASTATGPMSDSQLGNPDNILGEERDVTISVTSGTSIVSSGLITPAGPGPAGPDLATVLLFDTGVNGLGSLELTYDGIGTPGPGLGGVNFVGVWNAISVNLPDVQGEGLLTVEVEDTSMNVGSVSATVDAAGVYNFLHADPGYSGVNFMSVDRVTVTLNSTLMASDFAIAEIVRSTVIPEPGTLGLLAVVGIMAASVRFRYALR